MLCFVVGSRSCGARRLGGVDIPMGRAAVLLVPRSALSLSYHGVSARWRSHDNADEIRYLLGRCHSFLHGRVCTGN